MYESRPALQTRTKIVATLGPASWDEPLLTELLQAGVDVCRINCSHADHDSIRRQVARVRRAAMKLGVPTGILLDLQGPKIRTSKVPEPLELRTGDVLTVVMVDEQISKDRNDKRVGTTYPEMADDVQAGDRVLFADGALQGSVAAVRHDCSPKEVDILMSVGGPLGSNKGINLPGVEMSVPSLTEKDIADLAVGLEVGVDYVALSFVRSADDVIVLKEEMGRIGRTAPIIAKIEKPQAVKNIDAICEHANGVMVARGDLGVEVPIESVPVYQKHIIEAAHRHGALCITATQMLDSMERNPRPTRAETTDVANAILDGTDAVMLSGETAVGSYPIQAVRMMDSIAREVEGSRFFHSVPLDQLPPLPGSAGIVARAAVYAATERARPLVIFTWSGLTALYAGKARPRGPIFALTPHQRVADKLALAWGVTPIVIPMHTNVEELISTGEQLLLKRGDVKPGEEIVILGGRSPTRGSANLMKIHLAGAED
ncbi:MAG: pyruvate kinase [Alphaproteobacteria bacterium]|nr:pyruvate kinase [Alphaproteobacteria bacterium]